MENVSVLDNSYFLNELVDGIMLNSEKISYGKTNLSPAIINMIAEGGQSFFSYLKNLGLSKETNLMVLSSKHHYYYDESDLKCVKTLVNLKKFNLIKHPDTFLHTLFRILPQDANFIGCFSDSKSKAGHHLSQPSRMMNRFINILDSRTDRIMSRNEVSELLSSHGFKVIDMTEIDGITYFNAKPVIKSAELRA